MMKDCIGQELTLNDIVMVANFDVKLLEGVLVGFSGLENKFIKNKFIIKVGARCVTRRSEKCYTSNLFKEYG